MSPTEIVTLRRLMGLSQSDFGKEVGVGVRAVQKYESGESVPNGNAMIKLLELYKAKITSKDVSVDQADSIDLKGIPLEQVLLFVIKNEEAFMEHKCFRNMIELRVAKKLLELNKNENKLEEWISN